jgi:CubicO group peptidase (beta-lactamase class C family)
MYGALGHLFHDLVGNSWESTITHEVLTPLGMTSTFCQTFVEAKNVALPYIGTQRVSRADMTAVAAAGAMRSSIEDMTRWIAFHLDGGKTLMGERLLSVTSIELMQSKQTAVENPNPVILQGLEWLGKDVSYGLGWFLGSTRGLKAVYHPGFIDGFSTALVMIPQKRLGFVVLSNINLSPIPGLLVRDLLDSLLDRDSEVEKTVEAYQLSARDLSVIGEYDHPVFGSVSVERGGDHLVLNYHGHQWPLIWKDEKTADFVVTAFGVKIPLSAQFGGKSEKAERLSIPFSLDPRLEPQVFARSSS